MKLSEAQTLLGENARHFTEVYKLFSFRDDQLLKDYIDFIVREPVEWLKGFPSKLVSKGAFSKPKTSVIKLLKIESVITHLGEEYANNARDAIWQAFKNNLDSILLKRNRIHVAPVMEQTIEHMSIAHSESENEIQYEQPIDSEILSLYDNENTKSANVNTGKTTMSWEAKYTVLSSVVQSLLEDHKTTTPSLANATLLLLAALANA
jgi:hypothetical protein